MARNPLAHLCAISPSTQTTSVNEEADFAVDPECPSVSRCFVFPDLGTVLRACQIVPTGLVHWICSWGPWDLQGGVLYGTAPCFLLEFPSGRQ